MQAKFLTLLLMFSINGWSASAQDITSIFSVLGPVVKIPSEKFPLRPRFTLLCALSIAPGVTYETQWSGPEDAGIIDPATNVDHYAITNGTVRLMNGSDVPGTTLAIRNLSYQDAGVYICRGRSLATSNEEVPSWVSATINLQLDIDLSSKFNETVVMATTSDSTVELSCEMSAFIRPDSSLIWEGPDNQILTSGTGKYQITFSNGSRDTAVNGSGIPVPSRVSILTISNPEKSDEGVYTCSVMGTNKTIDLVIMINDTKTSPATTTSSDDHTKTEPDIQATTITTVTDKMANPQPTISTTKSTTGIVTQKIQSGSKSYVNTVSAFVIITSVAGVLLQYCI